MSCLLENALLSDDAMGPNPTPMAGVVFHYDKFTSADATQVCEAAYLGSKGIKVQVLVSPANLRDMTTRYHNLPDYPASAPKPEVVPMLFRETQLNVANMKSLMGMDNDDKSPPLYMSVVSKVLKELSLESEAGSGVKYTKMKARMKKQNLTEAQMGFLEMRFRVIDWFLQETCPPKIKALAKEINFQPGTITIVDLSCTHVTEADACLLYSIFVQVFLSRRGQTPLIIALDEAHKVRQSPIIEGTRD